MAEGAVFFLLDKLATLLQEEVKLFSEVRKEVVYIRAEFESMTAFLRVADSMEESDPEIKIWVKQVREVAHDTEDFLDVFMLRLMPRRHDENRYLVFFRKTFRSLKSVKVRLQIASEIQSIKSRVRDVADRHHRYCRKFDISKGGSSSTTHVVNNNKWYDSRGDALLVPEAELVGIDKRKQELIRLLVDQADDSGVLKVVSVVGMGGLGKTTLVKKVYDDAAVKKQFESHAWLAVSESPKMVELLRAMIQQLFGEIKRSVPQGLRKMDINRLKLVINEFLQQRRYLVVFDDIWSIHDWEAVKYAFPNNNSGSRIVLTTRFGDIASTSCKATGGNVYHLHQFSPEESWILFCRKAFPGDTNCPPHLEEISESILKRCGGLPLAIVAIGGVLATKSHCRIDDWDMLNRSLGGELQGNNKLQSMKNILSLSYNDLPWYLKICFLYLSIFPEDHDIECMRLIRLWTAEGFVQIREAGKTIEEVAEGYLYELLNRSLIQVAETSVDGRARTCRIHDLLREIATSKSRDQNIVAILASEAGNTPLPDKVRRLSIHNTTNTLVNSMQQIEQFSQLRSMLMFGVVDPLSSTPTLLSGNLKLLKVLDLRDASLETVPDEVLKLFHLKYLSLRGTKVKMLPKSIRNLVNLGTLDLKNTFVTVLPIEILKLQRLRHLLVYRYGTLMERYQQFHSGNGFEALKGIGGLSSLQKLFYVEASHGDGGSAIVSELGKLTQLKRLGILKLRREDGKGLCSSIEKLSNLRSLEVTSIEEDEILDIQSLSSTPRFLRGLYLRGRLDKLPNWILSLHNLVKVRLEWSKLRDDPMQSLKDLPNLMEIFLKDAYEREELCIKAGGFQRLKTLYLIKLKGLRWVRVEEGAMPLLETLGIKDCELVEEVPSGIEHLTKLQSLQLLDVHHELLEKVDRNKRGADYWKIAHIPQVNIFYFQNGCLMVRNL
ncbi:disease resistance protein RPM1-like [Cornus florida]|uniref:disease resistance protein RPM1-like n=1 Tax=Cornus florida TaxID=4283 RepID=UPI00289EBA9A|nr:disease resistance protein RPM1-like [Cornus florida]